LCYTVSRKKEREDKKMKLFNKKEEKKVAKRFFVTEPWSWGETFGFYTLEAAKAFCDDEDIDYGYIIDLGE
jgi:hypothetical protein